MFPYKSYRVLNDLFIDLVNLTLLRRQDQIKITSIFLKWHTFLIPESIIAGVKSFSKYYYKIIFIKYFSSYKVWKLHSIIDISITQNVWPMTKTSWIVQDMILNNIQEVLAIGQTLCIMPAVL